MTFVGLLARVISRSQGPYLHRTAKHKNTKRNIHASRGIRTHDPMKQAAKTYALDRTTTGIGACLFLVVYFTTLSQ
jgi:hypothetical protein